MQLAAALALNLAAAGVLLLLLLLLLLPLSVLPSCPVVSASPPLASRARFSFPSPFTKGKLLRRELQDGEEDDSEETGKEGATLQHRVVGRFDAKKAPPKDKPKDAKKEESSVKEDKEAEGDKGDYELDYGEDGFKGAVPELKGGPKGEEAADGKEEANTESPPDDNNEGEATTSTSTTTTSTTTSTTTTTTTSTTKAPSKEERQEATESPSDSDEGWEDNYIEEPAASGLQGKTDADASETDGGKAEKQQKGDPQDGQEKETTKESKPISMEQAVKARLPAKDENRQKEDKKQENKAATASKQDATASTPATSATFYFRNSLTNERIPVPLQPGRTRNPLLTHPFTIEMVLEHQRDGANVSATHGLPAPAAQEIAAVEMSLFMETADKRRLEEVHLHSPSAMSLRVSSLADNKGDVTAVGETPLLSVEHRKEPYVMCSDGQRGCWVGDFPGTYRVRAVFRSVHGNTLPPVEVLIDVPRLDPRAADCLAVGGVPSKSPADDKDADRLACCPVACGRCDAAPDTDECVRTPECCPSRVLESDQATVCRSEDGSKDAAAPPCFTEPSSRLGDLYFVHPATGQRIGPPLLPPPHINRQLTSPFNMEVHTWHATKDDKPSIKMELARIDGLIGHDAAYAGALMNVSLPYLDAGKDGDMWPTKAKERMANAVEAGAVLSRVGSGAPFTLCQAKDGGKRDALGACEVRADGDKKGSQLPGGMYRLTATMLDEKQQPVGQQQTAIIQLERPSASEAQCFEHLGVLDVASQACCASTCGVCHTDDSQQCSDRWGGAESCCANRIVETRTFCSHAKAAPCIGDASLSLGELSLIRPTVTTETATTAPSALIPLNATTQPQAQPFDLTSLIADLSTTTAQQPAGPLLAVTQSSAADFNFHVTINGLPRQHDGLVGVKFDVHRVEKGKKENAAALFLTREQREPPYALCSSSDGRERLVYRGCGWPAGQYRVTAQMMSQGKPLKSPVEVTVKTKGPSAAANAVGMDGVSTSADFSTFLCSRIRGHMSDDKDYATSCCPAFCSTCGASQCAKSGSEKQRPSPLDWARLPSVPPHAFANTTTLLTYLKRDQEGGGVVDGVVDGQHRDSLVARRAKGMEAVDRAEALARLEREVRERLCCASFVAEHFGSCWEGASPHPPCLADEPEAKTFANSQVAVSPLLTSISFIDPIPPGAAKPSTATASNVPLYLPNEAAFNDQPADAYELIPPLAPRIHGTPRHLPVAFATPQLKSPFNLQIGLHPAIDEDTSHIGFHVMVRRGKEVVSQLWDFRAPFTLCEDIVSDGQDIVKEFCGFEGRPGNYTIVAQAFWLQGREGEGKGVKEETERARRLQGQDDAQLAAWHGATEKEVSATFNRRPIGPPITMSIDVPEKSPAVEECFRSHGILQPSPTPHSPSLACCPAECGRCDNDDGECAVRGRALFLDPRACCPNEILKAAVGMKTYKSDSDGETRMPIGEPSPRCALQGAAPCVAATSGLSVALRRDICESALNGNFNALHNTCCSGSCGTCAADSICHLRQGGADGCCPLTITDQQQLPCSAKGAAPCLVDDGPYHFPSAEVRRWAFRPSEQPRRSAHGCSVDTPSRCVIYQVVTDRFALSPGSESDDVCAGEVESECQAMAGGVGEVGHGYRGRYCGGSFKGMAAKVAYLRDLHVTSLWMSPLMQNTKCTFDGSAPSNWERINSHFGTSADLQSLVTAAHSQHIGLIPEVVVNHVGRAGPHWGDVVSSQRPAYATIYPFNATHFYRPFAKCHPASEVASTSKLTSRERIRRLEQCWLNSYPDLDTTDPFVEEYLSQWALDVVLRYQFDGVAVRDIGHVDTAFWERFLRHLSTPTERGARKMWAIGEGMTFPDEALGSRALQLQHLAAYQHRQQASMFDGVLNYPLTWALREAFAPDVVRRKSMHGVAETFALMKQLYSAPGRAVNFLESVDMPRFLHGTLPWDMGRNEAPSRDTLSMDAPSVRQYQNALTIVGAAEGVPMFIYGTEQIKMADKDERAPLWLSAYDTAEGSLYGFLKTLSALRVNGHLDGPQRELLVEDDVYAFSRGDGGSAGTGTYAIVVATNMGVGKHTTIKIPKRALPSSLVDTDAAEQGLCEALIPLGNAAHCFGLSVRLEGKEKCVVPKGEGDAAQVEEIYDPDTCLAQEGCCWVPMSGQPSCFKAREGNGDKGALTAQALSAPSPSSDCPTDALFEERWPCGSIRDQHACRAQGCCWDPQPDSLTSPPCFTTSPHSPPSPHTHASTSASSLQADTTQSPPPPPQQLTTSDCYPVSAPGGEEGDGYVHIPIRGGMPRVLLPRHTYTPSAAVQVHGISDE
ncbi:unnamed protein product [Vitrella brassicaformis CCMP3155]|uniref:P-type domain-containing protein n=1 Tax=Vitrella brassicaformis (strain CCMP3155) TaxID=1169540 RepID=A0A0G4F786_VITBC|nr:unnamed protein product [Vitrella brassicaformis CCMP3155]|eukprot:CEM08115.1 unnamed protein product [Vitrella brassicaformis CCMP3155]